ncbi:MAG: 1-acyl-sn-glycerol-3-phosphate acyltransferase, partial [Actinobacteria bacterium]|nr:1-acyl-sn-glycerol-3-phosphate acyltransferase [Actinomycetota bacterium]
WISPEGGRSRTGKLRPFKKGGIIMAIQSAATIIPVGIQGTEKALKPDTFDFCLDQDVVVNMGTPIEASRYTLEQKDDLLEEVRAVVAKLTGEE